MAGERMMGDVGGQGPARGAAERGSSAREGGRLRESEQERGALRALFDSALDAILVATDDREYVDANPAACELLGVPREKLLGSRLEDFVPEGQEDGARAAWSEFLERGWMEGTITLRRADGSFCVAEFRARAGFLPGQHLSVLRDVTERKRAEDALKESEEQHRLVVESALDYGIFTTDPDGRIETWPPGAAAVYGWPPEEALGQPAAMLYVPQDRASRKPEEEFETARRDGVAPDVRWQLRKDGSRVFIEGTNRHLIDSSGGTRGFLKIGQDVTRRREVEEALRASEERFRTVTEQSPLAVHVFAPDGTCLRMNSSSLELWKLEGEPLANVFEDGRMLAALLAPHVMKGAAGSEIVTEPLLYDPAFAGRSGEPRWLRVFVYPLCRTDGDGVDRGGPGGGVSEIVLMVQDATEEKRAEEQRERLRARELSVRAEAAERERISRELHDRVAHSMGVAHQSLELYAALTESNPSRAAQKLELARETIRHALDQTRSLSTELRRLHEEEIAEGLPAAFAALVETSVSDGVHVDFSFFGDEALIPKHVAGQVYLIMREAVRNAVKHSGCNRIKIRLEVGDDEVVGVVEEDGEGFDPEAVEKASPSRGVGLRSMRERAQMLGGELRLVSTSGEGTRVEVRVSLQGRS